VRVRVIEDSSQRIRHTHTQKRNSQAGHGWGFTRPAGSNVSSKEKVAKGRL
jgi:hypothetical protein